MNDPKMYVEKLFEDAKLPVRANPTDSGADVFAYKFEKFDDDVTTITLGSRQRVLVNTGISATVGLGYEIQVRPRSGNALKKGLTVLNTPGTIDEAYRGPIGVIIINLSDEPQIITVGDKIAQLVVCPVILAEIIEVDSLNITERNEGGFGHTGT
jgi:dUTP pyrophosphatase